MSGNLLKVRKAAQWTGQSVLTWHWMAKAFRLSLAIAQRRVNLCNEWCWSWFVWLGPNEVFVSGVPSEVFCGKIKPWHFVGRMSIRWPFASDLVPKWPWDASMEHWLLTWSSTLVNSEKDSASGCNFKVFTLHPKSHKYSRRKTEKQKRLTPANAWTKD